MGAKWFRDTAPTADPQNGDYDFGFDHSVGAITIYQLQSGNWVSVGTATTNGSAPTGNAATLDGRTAEDIADMGQPSISWTEFDLNTDFFENSIDDPLRYGITSDDWVVICGTYRCIELWGTGTNIICKNFPSTIVNSSAIIPLHFNNNVYYCTIGNTVYGLSLYTSGFSNQLLKDYKIYSVYHL